MSQISNPSKSGAPGGGQDSVQFNDAGTLAGDAGLVYQKAFQALTVAGNVVIDAQGMRAGVFRPDGADDSSLVLAGAPDVGDGSRGARVVAFGNEAAAPGSVWIQAGAPGEILINRGIRFGPGVSSVADYQTADAYQETPWQPRIAGTSGQSGQTYALQTGFALKWGRLIVAEFAVALTWRGTIAGNVAIDGFPWASAYGAASCQCVFYGMNAQLMEVRAQMIAGAQYAVLNSVPAGGATQNIYPLIEANLSNSADIRGCMIYFAAA